jgi:DNA-directed RNA polymerase specialized sigma subunit|tara:strand:+ start:14 stop:349 length:336 start_codon:yes stop_codon:yes gene_type:complete
MNTVTQEYLDFLNQTYRNNGKAVDDLRKDARNLGKKIKQLEKMDDDLEYLARNKDLKIELAKAKGLVATLLKEGKTFKELGVLLGVSAPRASEIYYRAVEKLKAENYKNSV